MKGNIIAVLACGLILLGFAALVVFGGILDTPGSQISQAIAPGIVAVLLLGAGAALANLYERGRI